MFEQHFQEQQDEVFRKMSPERRLQIAGEMYAFAKRVVAQSSGEKIYERVRRAAHEDGWRP